MLPSVWTAAVVTIGVGLWGSLARAVDDQTADGRGRSAEASRQPASADEIARLVEQLDSDRYSERETASEKLSAVGRPAVAALTKAALGGSLEVTDRSIRVLRRLLAGSDEAAKTAAKIALETIAGSDRSAAAGRAKAALNAAQPQSPAPGALGGITIGGGPLQIFGNARARRLSVKNVNGAKEIEAQEDGRSVKISDHPQQGIQIEVTTKKDGKDTVQKYQAKDADELKKKHPEGYKLYQEYSQNQAGAGGVAAIQIMIQGQGQGQLQVVPGIVPPPAMPQPQGIPQPRAPQGQVVPAAMGPGHAIDALATQMKMLNKRLETLSKDEALNSAAQESKDELKKQIEELKRRLSDLQRELRK
ncbi:MAG: hypothetical protein ABSF26_01930 [Thermoguttaceae bacterium]|jgi:hypothetical protein